MPPDSSTPPSPSPGPGDPPGLDRAAVLASLRARVARIGGVAERAEAPAIPLCPELDRELGGGLPRAALHEILAGTDGHRGGHAGGAAAGFAALLLARSGGTVFWIAREPDAWPPGLVRFGLPPSRLIIAQPRSGTDALWAMEEALRCPAVSGVLLMSERPDATAARRLQLAAETGGGIGLLLRESDEKADGSHGPAMATTRWRVTGRASGRPNDLGDPQWSLELLRARGGRPARWTVTWRMSSETLVVEGMEERESEERGGAAPARRVRRG